MSAFFFIISQPKYILWVLKRTVSIAFEHPKHVKTDG